MKLQHFLIPMLILIYSCEKEKTAGTVPIFNANPGSVYISNEGNFTSGNASITNYNPSDGSVNSNVFTGANGTALGDICQSMSMINGKLYFVVNNSGKIEVCNPSSATRIHTITGLNSPRYIIDVGSNKGYITDGYSNFISIVNLSGDTITGSIPMTGFAEQMLLHNNKVYVTNTSSDYLFIIDPGMDAIVDSILISKGANSIREDANGKIWVLCSGDYLLTYNGALYRIDPSTKQIEVNIAFQPNKFPWRLKTNGSKDALYFLNEDVWKMNINDNTLPASPFITSAGNNFYGLGTDSAKNEIYVSDAIDYIQNGRIYRYNSSGTEITNFLAGIIPGDFLFLP